MVEDDTYCIDILTQVSAATRALEAVALSLLDDHLRHCVVHFAQDPGAGQRRQGRRGIGRHRPAGPVLTSIAADPQTYSVTGMTCGHCVHAVTEEVRAIPGVTDVAVDLDAGGPSTLTVAAEARSATPPSPLPSTRPATTSSQRHDHADVRLTAGDAAARDRARHRRDDLRLLRRPVEKKLNKLDGVQRQRQLRHREGQGHLRRDGDARGPAGHGRGDRLHRHAACPPPRAELSAQRVAGPGPDDDREASAWRQRLVVSAVLTVPVLLLSMVPALQFDNWQWLSLTLASPVVVWGGLAVPPRRLGQPPPRRGHDGHAHLGRRRARRTCGRCGRCSSPTPA